MSKISLRKVESKYLFFKAEKGRERIISVSDIIFVEKINKIESLFVCNGYEVVVKATLKCIIESINQAGMFFESHRSYIINIEYVDRIQNYGNYSEIYFKVTQKKALMSSERKKMIYNLDFLECL